MALIVDTDDALVTPRTFPDQEITRGGLQYLPGFMVTPVRKWTPERHAIGAHERQLRLQMVREWNTEELLVYTHGRASTLAPSTMDSATTLMTSHRQHLVLSPQPFLDSAKSPLPSVLHHYPAT
jgi:hypothetical protein